MDDLESLPEDATLSNNGLSYYIKQKQFYLFSFPAESLPSSFYYHYI